MESEEFIKQYERFFSKVTHIDDGDKSTDAIRMHSMEAVGGVENLAMHVEGLKDVSAENLLKISEKMLKESRIEHAFFYYALSEFKKGKNSLYEVADDAMIKFGVAGEYSITKKHKMPEHKNKTTIFLDYDDTIIVSPKGLSKGIRPGLKNFVQHFREKKGGRSYSLIITSASSDLGDKMQRDQAGLELFDAVYSVPGISNIMNLKEKISRLSDVKMGKLYTDICKKLNINPSYSIVITDSIFDKPVENYFPIITLVTNGADSAKQWQECIEYFESNAKGNILKGARIAKKFPSDILEEDVLRFDVSKDLKLYASHHFGRTYFINHSPVDNIRRLRKGFCK